MKNKNCQISPKVFENPICPKRFLRENDEDETICECTWTEIVKANSKKDKATNELHDKMDNIAFHCDHTWPEDCGEYLSKTLNELAICSNAYESGLVYAKQ